MSKNFIERPRFLCSLGGAMMTVSALPDTIPVLHTAVGCAGNTAWTQNGGGGLQIGGYCSSMSVPGSNLQDKEVIFGGVDRLTENIRNAAEVIDGRLYFVITGCISEMIGDDVKSVIRDFKDEGLSIVGALTGGFRGNSYYGYDLVMKSLVSDYLDRNLTVKKGTVNIFGIVPFMDVFWRGNLEGLRSLLEKLGLDVNTFFTSSDSLDSIRESSRAELNIVVSDIYGIETAETFNEIFNTPYIVTRLPIGARATDEFLRKTGEALSLDKDKVESVIAEENRVYYSFLDTAVDAYNDMDLQRYAVVIGDVNYAYAVTRFISDDIGWLPELVVVTDSLRDDQKEKLASIAGNLESGLKPGVVFETDTSEIIRHVNALRKPNSGERYYNALSPAFVIGSSLDRDLAQSIGAAHLSLSFPVANRAVLNRGYAGYSGGLRLIEDLLSAIVAGR